MHFGRLFLVVSAISIFALAKVQYTVTPNLHKFTIPNAGSIYTLFHPATTKKYGSTAPLVFFIGGSEGGIWVKEDPTIEDLQKEGYNVVTVGYFKLEGLPDAATRIDLEPFGEAIKYYKKHSGVDPKRIGIIGGSKGAELALLLGSHYPDIHLVAGFVPSHVAFQGTDIAIFSHHSTWRFQGKEVPFVPYPHFSFAALKGVFSGENYRDMHLLALEDKEVVERARIQVERINGPIFLLSAKRDQFWPSTEMSDEIMKRLDKHHFSFVHEHVAWDTNHFILQDPKAWNTILNFIRKQWPK